MSLDDYLERSIPTDKRLRLRRQWTDAVTSHEVTCGCGQLRAIECAFRCFFCGEWSCPKCAALHFAPGAPAGMPVLPVGTPIRFLKDLSGAADEAAPAQIYALKGETGTVTGHGCVEGHWVKANHWVAPFGARLGEEFEPA